MTYKDLVLANSPFWYLTWDSALNATNEGSGTLAYAAGNATRSTSGGMPNGGVGHLSNNGTQYQRYTSSAVSGLNGTNWTIEVWFKKGNGAANGWEELFNLYRSGEGKNELVFFASGNADTKPAMFLRNSAGVQTRIFSSTAVTDTNWHHMAAVKSGTTVTLYLDGNAVGSASSIGSFAFSGTYDLWVNAYGSFSPNENFYGSTDEFAFYASALTQSTLQAHRNYGIGTNVVADVDAATLAAQAYDTSQSFSYTVSVDAASTTASAPEPTIEHNRHITTLISNQDDTPTNNSNNYLWVGDSYGTGPVSAGKHVAYIGFDPTLIPTGKQYVSVTMRLRVLSTLGTFKVGVYAGSGTVTEEGSYTVTPGSLLGTFDLYNGGGGGFINVTLPNASPHSVYVLKPIVDENNKYATFSDRTSAGFEPTLIIDWIDTDSVLQTPTVNLEAYDATVEAGTAVDLTTAEAFFGGSDASVGTGSTIEPPAVAITAEAKEVAIETTSATVVTLGEATLSARSHDVTIAQEVVALAAASVSLAAPVAIGAIPLSTSVDAATMGAQAHDATVEVKYNAIIQLDAPSIIVYRKQLESVNGDPIVIGEDEDPYFVSTMRNNPTIWYRFNDQTAPVKPRVYGNSTNLEAYSATVTNGVFGLGGGVNDRRFVRFNGTTMFTQPGEPFWSDNDERHSTSGTLEFSIKTSKQNQFVMRMDDIRNGILFNTNTPPVDIYIVDGKIQVRRYSSDLVGPNAPVQSASDGEVVFTSFANVADDNWHHIVLTYEPDRTGDRYSVGRINLYVDGHLDIRKYHTVQFGFPDWIGGRPSYPFTYRGYFELPQTAWFVGDIAEVVYYDERYFNEDAVNRQYDTFIGRDPVYLEAARVSTKGEEAVIKGNKPRLLVLDFGCASYADYGGGKPIANDDYIIGQTSTNRTVFTGYGKWTMLSQYGVNDPRQKVGPLRAWDNDGMLMYNVSVLPTTTADQNWTDAKYDTQRLLDLDKDLNMDDYDLISIVGFPQSKNDMGSYYFYDYAREFGGPTIDAQFDALIEQIRKQVVRGKSLISADPASAVALGVIDRAEYVPTYREGVVLDSRLGAVTGLYDWHGADRADLDSNAAPTLELAARYRDLHKNQFQRVRTLVPGLTDVKGFWIHTDSYEYRSVDPFAQVNRKVAYRHEDRTENGLTLGDEFYMMGNGGLDSLEVIWDIRGTGLPRVNGWVATPIENIKAGVAVTSFGSKIGMKDTLVDNPYKDYAVSIVVRPGDTLKGETIAGKVYVNFTEAWVNWAAGYDTKPMEIIPDDGWAPGRKHHTSDANRYWTYSEDRGQFVGSEITISNPIDSGWFTSPSGGRLPTGGGSGGGGGTTYYQMGYKSFYEIKNIDVAPMAYRGLAWLLDDGEENGNVTVGLETASATIKNSDAQVNTTGNVEVTVGVGRLNIDVQPMPDVTEADATVLVGTPTVSLRAQEFVETVDLGAASITLNAPEVESDLLNSVDRIWVTMPVHNITLIMEEE